MKETYLSIEYNFGYNVLKCSYKVRCTVRLRSCEGTFAGVGAVSGPACSGGGES